MLKLKDYQQRAINLTVKYGAIYHMLDAGLGKTAIAIKAIEKVGIPAFVLGPKLAITRTWPKEIKKWSNLTYSVLTGNEATREHRATRAAGCDITLLNYEGLDWFIRLCNRGKFKLKKFFIVLDEPSNIKFRGSGTLTGRSNRFEMLQQIVPMFSPYRVALSATPVPESLLNLWPQYYLLDGGQRLGFNFYSFRDRFFNYSGKPHYRTDIHWDGEARIYKAISDITFQLNAEDHIKMPLLTQNKIMLPMPANLKKWYNKMDVEYILQFDGGDVSIARSEAIRGHKLRQLLQGGVYTESGRQLLQSPAKARYLRGFVEQSAGNPILCAIQFKFEYDILCKTFNKTLPIIYGNTSETKANDLLDQWDAGKLPLLLVHPDSVSQSLNMQDGGHILVWLALPWSFEQYYQLIRRLYRQGQQRGVISHSVCFEGTMDEVVANNLMKKAGTDSRLKKAMGKQGLQL